jgi:hypothetical protein
MCIRRPSLDYESKQPRDMTSDLHFVWKDDRSPVYIMDNHRGALWCWINCVPRDERYSFFHLDYHWDATSYPDVDLAVFEANLDRFRGDLDAFDALKRRGHPGALGSRVLGQRRQARHSVARSRKSATFWR